MSLEIALLEAKIKEQQAYLDAQVERLRVEGVFPNDDHIPYTLVLAGKYDAAFDYLFARDAALAILDEGYAQADIGTRLSTAAGQVLLALQDAPIDATAENASKFINMAFQKIRERHPAYKERRAHE